MNIENDQSTERGTVLNSVTAIDNALAKTLIAFLNDTDTSAAMLDPEQFGALSTFRTRTNLCFALGLISRDEAHCCRAVGKVRDQFARDFNATLLNPKTERYVSEFTGMVLTDRVRGKLNAKQMFSSACITLFLVIANRIPDVLKTKRATLADTLRPLTRRSA